MQQHILFRALQKEFMAMQGSSQSQKSIIKELSGMIPFLCAHTSHLCLLTDLVANC